MFRSVRVHLTALTVAVVVCLYAILAVSVYSIVQHVVYKAMDRQLQTVAKTVKSRGVERGIVQLPAETFGYAVGKKGASVTNAKGAMQAAMAQFVANHPRRLTHTTWTGPDGVPYRVLVLRDPPRGFVMIAVDVRREVGVLHQLLMVLIVVGGVGIVMAAAAGFFLAERVLRPVKSAWNRQLEFVADASHELRTPLSVVQSNLGVVLQHTDQTVAENLEWVDNAFRETRRMSKLVEDLLTLARSDAQAQPIQKEPLSLTDVVQQVCELFQPVLAHQELTYEIQPGLDVVGDRDRLHQLCVILVDNAAKYTPEGGKIIVRAFRLRTTVLVEVADTGVGIAKEDLPNVFQRFYQAGGQRRPKGTRGAGLGLAIAKWIVDSHGGKIEVESQLGRGTTFRVTLPAHRNLSET